MNEEEELVDLRKEASTAAAAHTPLPIARADRLRELEVQKATWNMAGVDERRTADK